jgi:signal transduction histidine kinase
MTRMVDDLLFLARSDSASELQLQHVEMRGLLARVSARGATLARERGVTLESTIDVGGAVWADAARLEQAILVLVDNAAKYSPAGATVRLSARESSAGVHIGVTDDGCGIPAADLPQIFDRFYRAPGQRSRRSTGAGLGLGIARAIVETHGGRIRAVSQEGVGTEMTIDLPLFKQQQKQQQSGTDVSHRESVTAAPHGGNA